jgi:nucleoside-diphosphate-sugar epimerase
MKFSILGGAGFVGRHLARHLRQIGFQVEIVSRGAEVNGTELGHVIYAIGLTGNFRERYFDTVEAHVNVLSCALQRNSFESWLYLSSARVYGGLPAGSVATETLDIPVRPSKDALYDLSKLLGESLCLSLDRPTIRVARLSNVYGGDQSKATFLGEILDDLQQSGSATIRESPESSKDYVSIRDVVNLLALISLSGRHRIYNVASSRVTTHKAIADRLQELTGYPIKFMPNAPRRTFPRIDVSRVEDEFGFTPTSILDDLPELLRSRERCRSQHANGWISGGKA